MYQHAKNKRENHSHFSILRKTAWYLVRSYRLFFHLVRSSKVHKPTKFSYLTLIGKMELFCRRVCHIPDESLISLLIGQSKPLRTLPRKWYYSEPREVVGLQGLNVPRQGNSVSWETRKKQNCQPLAGFDRKSSVSELPVITFPIPI